MEGEAIELSSECLDVLEELVFTMHYTELVKKVGTDGPQVKKCLLKLLENELIIAAYPGPDQEIEFEIENFKEYYSEYYYLATKNGLRKVFC